MATYLLGLYCNHSSKVLVDWVCSVAKDSTLSEVYAANIEEIATQENVELIRMWKLQIVNMDHGAIYYDYSFTILRFLVSFYEFWTDKKEKKKHRSPVRTSLPECVEDT